MNNKHRKTLEAIFADPINPNLDWRLIEGLLVGVGCEVTEGNGSQVAFTHVRARLTIHRPHPNKEALRYRVKLVRDFLLELGITP